MSLSDTFALKLKNVQNEQITYQIKEYDFSNITKHKL